MFAVICTTGTKKYISFELIKRFNEISFQRKLSTTPFFNLEFKSDTAYSKVELLLTFLKNNL